MNGLRLEDERYDTLREKQEESWTTRGPDSEGVRMLLFARGHMWDVDGTNWRYEVVDMWTPSAFIEAHDHCTGSNGEAVAWLRARQRKA